ncbi:MAG: phosphotransferase, partial [Acidimicrobiia bacterium]
MAERRMPGGNRRQAWLIDVRDLDGSSRPLFLRYDMGDAASTDDPYTLHREALLGQALAGKGIPVAAVVAVHPRHQAVLTERADGDVAFYRIDDAVQQAAVARDFVSHVAALHRLDVTSFDLPGFGPLAPLPALVHRELDTWAGMYRDTGRPEPMIELGLRWLRANVPAAEGPVVLV